MRTLVVVVHAVVSDIVDGLEKYLGRTIIRVLEARKRNGCPGNNHRERGEESNSAYALAIER